MTDPLLHGASFQTMLIKIYGVSPYFGNARRFSNWLVNVIFPGLFSPRTLE